MPSSSLHSLQNDTTSSSAGTLEINVTSSIGFFPIKNAKISISITGEPESVIEQANTNESGRTDIIRLPAPPIEYSLEPSETRPYSEYNITIEAQGYEPLVISGSQILADTKALQPASLIPLETADTSEEIIKIPDHTLYGDYPPKIPEDEIKPMEESGEIVLSRIVIPEYVVVHTGEPDDSSAPNYYVRYKDYIKNVVSCEIYPTWPEETIYANTLAILSFTMNRVYTEWYRNKGYNFTITSSTAYDQKFMYGRNIFTNVDEIVNTIFANFLSRPGVRQPILTSYCDGNRVQCEGLSQWGSKYLGDEGYTPIEIVRYYYGNDMYINTSEFVSGVPSSFPGYNLTIGATGSKVQQVQEQLNRIAQNYPIIPVIPADGVFGEQTAAAVKAFQKIFNMPETGIIDYPTWYEISNIYVGVSRIAEPS